MNAQQREHVAAAISYIERHLHEKLDLETVAQAACYSKYHLHRMFTESLGMTMHGYIRRRQFTEAARRLVYSGRPIVEIALTAGCESQQTFTAQFKSLYKQTPLEYRQNGFFYPLQLELRLDEGPSAPDFTARGIAYAVPEDLPGWMRFSALVIDGFPCLEEGAHLKRLGRYIRQRQALLIREGPVIIGAAAFSREAGSIDFLAAHPQYRRCGIEQMLLDYMTRDLFAGREVSITTFREGDRADTGQRETYRRLGFAAAELLTEFGYPVQRLVLPPGQGRRRDAR